LTIPGAEHDEKPVGRPDEASPGNAGQHEEDAGPARHHRGGRPVRRRHGQGGDDLQERRQAGAIDPSLLGDDRDMLEDLVAAAFNDAVRKAEATTQEKMAGISAGLPLPPGFKMPF